MSDLDRAIAIIEDSRQTHVNWAEWRRKGNGTDSDHEMIGDLDWHENAIRDYDHVLAVLRAAPRAEGLQSDTPASQIEAEAGAAPRAEGLDVDRLARELAWASEETRQRLLVNAEWRDHTAEEAWARLTDFQREQWIGRAARLSRPSDERVPESEER